MLSWLVHFCLVQILCIYCKQEFIEIMENKESKESMERKEIERILSGRHESGYYFDPAIYQRIMRRASDYYQVWSSGSSDASHEVRKILSFF